MNLLIEDLPTSIIEINSNLYFDTEYITKEDEEYLNIAKRYSFSYDYKSIINIMMLFEDKEVHDEDKIICALKIFYTDIIPSDMVSAYEKMMIFLDMKKKSIQEERRKDNTKRLWSWEQDGNHIYSAINYSHNDILIRNKNLHWWEFMTKFMQLKEDCLFSDIISNRLAHQKGKATKEQKAAMKEYPELYALKEDRKKLEMDLNKIKEIEKLLNKH